MQLFGTSFNLDLGGFRLRVAFTIDDRGVETGVTRIEDMPRLEITK